MRLTEWRGEHAAVVEHHENYIDKLAAYKDAVEQGRLVTLPCKKSRQMYNDLVERLRNKRCQICPICREAADAIEELTAIAESYKRSMEEWADEAAIAQSRLVSVTTRLPDEWKSLLTCMTQKCIPLPEPSKEE